MNKKVFSFSLLLVTLFSLLGMTTNASAEENGEFRVGMEAGYAPFNWSQKNDAHGAVPIQGNSYAGGYDVQISKKIADGLGRKLVIVQTKWDGLAPALQSGKIDAIIAGMSPTAERKKEIAFTNPYYESLNTFHYGLIDQIPNVNKQQAMDNFSAMRTALASGMIDGYVSERPEGITATSVNKELKMLEFPKENGFDASAEDSQVAVGMRKGDPDIEKVNKILAGISQDERTKIMDQAIKDQPAATDSDEQKTGLINDFKNIWNQYGDMFLRGAGLTLFIALIGTVVGTTLGLLIGVFRTIPDSENPVARFFQKLGNLILSIYIEVFRGTPMMVQAMVIFYGLALAFGISLDRTVAALFIVSVNTGAYMSEIVRGGIFAVDKGQFEAAQAIGMTHGQTMRKVVIPQVLRNILPATGNEFVINIKDTAVLSVIGVADLFFQGNAASGANFQFFQTFTIVGIMYLVMTFVITRILRVVERKMDGPSAYVKVEELTEEGKES